MKRYRVLDFDFDSRANLPISMSHEEIQHQYGQGHLDKKRSNFVDFGNIPPSIIANHNVIFRQIREAFVIGAYYPALVGTCALGEKILNHLILDLRDFYKDNKHHYKFKYHLKNLLHKCRRIRKAIEYNDAFTRKSFTNWKFMINILSDWGILVNESKNAFLELETIRHKSIHFNPKLMDGIRDTILEAIGHLKNIISYQFGILDKRPWIIPNTKGALFIKKDYENDPFVKYYFLPCCQRVGYKHKLDYFMHDSGNKAFKVIDNFNYKNDEISDEEFARLFEKYKDL